MLRLAWIFVEMVMISVEFWGKIVEKTAVCNLVAEKPAKEILER